MMKTVATPGYINALIVRRVLATVRYEAGEQKQVQGRGPERDGPDLGDDCVERGVGKGSVEYT